ncbi:PAS domain S-box protein [Sinimarinibacterium sp. CAU 1509]|uniref:PAS domain-containing sensor histidine kinase n=1 Tax=Sinimarinibacterium sp. CAU 1509 TaxID=2562283 RepID=UPI0010AC61C9|nr:PAS domain S-box protein [Sinimarinibacterium sp. CAU 1509]TJY56604.1 PAS domain S-box protein [Sinimarinibacterium sp. CAU 1509]
MNADDNGSAQPVQASIDPRWYRDLVESAPDGMVLIDAEGRIVLVNAQAERLFGYSRHELIGLAVEQLVPDKYRSGHLMRREGFFAEPRAREMGVGVELPGRRKDGTEFPVEISLSPIRTDRGLFVMAAIRNASDRKRANDKFRALLETAPDAIVIIDDKGVIRLVNAQTERLFGYHRDSLIGKPIEVLIPERLRARHIDHRVGYFDTPKVREMGAGQELLGRRKDSSEFPVEISLSPLDTEEGTWATAAVRDVSDRKRERDAATRLAAIVESSNDAILGKDINGRITSWNKAAELMYGYAAEEIIGQPVELLCPPERQGEEMEILERVRRGEQIKHYETERINKSGRRVEMSLTISPIRDAQGRIVGASTIGRDISEYKKAESKFRDLLETAPDAMVIIDTRGRIALVNARAERVFGFSRDEMIGQPIETLIPERLREQHEAHRNRFIGDPRQRPMGTGLDLWARRKDGSEFPVEISLGPLQTSEGSLVTAAVRDITERKAFEQQLADYAESLKRSNRELEQFAYVASHDLRAPLRSLSGFSQLLQKRYGDQLDAQAAEFLSYITQSAEHMQALIDDLLAFSRVSTVDKSMSDVDCEAVLAQVERQLRAQIESRGARITHDPLPRVTGIEHELVQLMQNLVSNGIKFQPGEHPHVHVSAQRLGEFWQFSVRDNGIGLAPEYREKIFLIFQRLHTSEEYEGTGVGLAICKKIVEHHGGNIWVESEPGKGATFFFTLKSI